MKVLFTCLPAYGHFHPLVPLARALKRAGHQVAFATAADFCRLADRAGFTAFPSGLTLQDSMAQTFREFPELRTKPYAVLKMVFYLAPRMMIKEVLDAIQDWRPDVVVHDAHELAGPLAATLTSIPYVNHSWGCLMMKDLENVATSEIGPVCREWGLASGEIDMYRHLYLDVWPPSLQIPQASAVATRKLMRPLIYDGEDESGSRQLTFETNRKPRAYLTLGTIFNWNMRSLAVGAEALKGHVDFLITAGPNADLTVLKEVAPSLRIHRYVPQSSVLPECDFVICHGGSGTILGALSHGLPLLIIPQGADHFINAQQCVQAGVGRWLSHSYLNPKTLLSEIEILLNESSYRQNATRIMDEIADMPHPLDCVSLIENLTIKDPAA